MKNVERRNSRSNNRLPNNQWLYQFEQTNRYEPLLKSVN